MAVNNNIAMQLFHYPIIPAVRSAEDFKSALSGTKASSVILLFGDINSLPTLLEQAQQHNKRLVLHLDLFGGIGKDKAGIKFLSRLGVNAIITTKHQLCRLAREAGMVVIQRVFIMDSEAVKTSVQIARSSRPDAVEVLPATIPAVTVAKLIKETGLPIMAGGLVTTPEEITEALKKGMSAISTSRKELWDSF